MKNKRLLYVLLPAVLVVWGLIFQRIWSATQETNGPAGSALPALALAPTNAPRLRPTLLLSYTDPFKGGKQPTEVFRAAPSSVSRAEAVTSPRPAGLNFPTVPLPVAAIPVVWPPIKYLGSINNTNRNNGVALLNVDGKELMIKVGDIKPPVQVARLYRDSVQVVFQGKKKTVKRTVEQ